MTDKLNVTQADELLREIFLHGHAEGWTGNQTRRDVRHVDAEKGWSLYVSNGALEKTKTRHRMATDTQVSKLREALEAVLDAHVLVALRGRDHVPSMRLQQSAISAGRAALTDMESKP